MLTHQQHQGLFWTSSHSSVIVRGKNYIIVVSAPTQDAGIPHTKEYYCMSWQGSTELFFNSLDDSYEMVYLPLSQALSSNCCLRPHLWLCVVQDMMSNIISGLLGNLMT